MSDEQPTQPSAEENPSPPAPPTLPKKQPSKDANLARDIVMLVVMLGLLGGVAKIFDIDISQTLNLFGNQYTVVNNCAEDVLLMDGNVERVRIPSAETLEFDVDATHTFEYINSNKEPVPLTLRINDDLEIRGVEIPAQSDIFGQSPQIIACPTP